MKQTQLKKTEQDAGQDTAKAGRQVQPGRSEIHPELDIQDVIGNHGVLSRLGISVQPKLRVSEPGDVYEQEADRVAETVMRMPRPADAPAPLPPARDIGMHPALRGVLRSSGRPLDKGTREYFEPRFGHDFSTVRVHEGSNAAESARAMNARAYTVGRDVVFGEGQYSPNTQEGRRLMAHELVHSLQHRGSFDVRRKIIIGQKYYNPQRDYKWVREKHGMAMVEFLESKHNSGKPPEYTFRDYKHLHYEIRVRSRAIEGMGKAKKRCCDYPSFHKGGFLNPLYWKQVGAFHFIVKSPLPPGKSPSDAIDAIFQSHAGTELECNSMMVAVQYYAILKSIGRIRFNKRFPGGWGIVIKPVMVGVSGRDKPNALMREKLYKRFKISGFKDLLPGDWVYFLNVPDYRRWHPGGNWSGEHALYIGGNTFSGFGLQHLTNDQIIYLLLQEYNKGIPDSKKKSLSDVPGIVPQVIRRPVVESYVP